MPTQTLADVLSQLELYSDGTSYKLLKIHPKATTLAASIIAEVADPFLCMIADKDEITLIIGEMYIEEFDARLRDAVISASSYRLITFDIELQPTLIGFMAAVSQSLAQAGVSILPIAAFSRDHIFVPADQFETAMSALEALKS